MKRPSDWPLLWKLLGLLLLVSALPLTIITAVEVRESQQQIYDSSVAYLSARADSLANQIDDMHASLQRSDARLALGDRKSVV